MGKKDKNKKKLSGMVKTAIKTEKKLSAKQKKELAALGEEDIEKVIADIEREEARRQRVVEIVIEPPSRRVNFSLVAHPFKDELIMFGGEFHDGQKTTVYGDLFTYNLNKKEWTVIKAPGAPPPRCGHQAIITSTNKGEMWIFGGEFSSPSESQFYHYKDLWVYRTGEKKWEKIVSPGGPSARSGHRMIHMKKKLIVFGGFYDNLRDCKYYNDIHMFNLETYTWHKIECAGNPPAPRSGCIMLPVSEKVLIYGGYSKDKIKAEVDKGQVHTDMFLLSQDKNDQTGLKWKWVLTKQSGLKCSPRCGMTGVLVQPHLAYAFGGVFDNIDDDEELQGTFYNDLLSLDLEKFQWHEVTLTGKREQPGQRKKEKAQKEDQTDESSLHEDKESFNNRENSETEVIDSNKPVQPPIIYTDEDDVFTLTVSSSAPCSTQTNNTGKAENLFVPSPRINPGLVVKNNILYLYGGMYEVGDKQFTFNDFYSLDCRKMDEWKTIIHDDLSLQEWNNTSSSDSEDDDDGDDDTNSNSSDNE
ncbi:PREDICTED: kelch domain-containing protein 4 [Polistes dominula]|uniref:Kelch domain-containing protein 4 n=1 Tax=Polistes dominula TaxID=743375 RepID=A0ABM1ITY6_POLDO|nr:PREDICTED: kelch domain-containing protein 4 [Polistes dominula]XP_015183673.1 PREDICTED: kelch domain-containing protein 4 [Polistes dominula]